MKVKPQQHDTEQLRAILLVQIARLIECLLSGRTVHRTAHEYRIGTQGSISIRLMDGSYFNHETGEGGDIFTLIEHVLKVDFKGALLFAHNFIGNRPLTPIPLTNRSHKKPDDYAIKQRSKAQAMLGGSAPIHGTLAEAYLRHRRGITMGALPASLGFIEQCYNYTASGSYPAMIAPIQDVQDNVIAAHVTYLDPNTGDKLKGDKIRPRLIFAPCGGGAIRLSPLRKQVIVCEGIEDGLSILQSVPDACVWVSVGTSGMVNIMLPDSVSEVVIASDNDPQGGGQTAALKLATRLKKEGRVARIATPAPYKDFNELLLKGDVSCLNK